MNSVIIEAPTAIKNAAIMVSDLYIDLILLYYLYKALIPKKKCKILAWVFLLHTLVTDIVFNLAAILLHTNVPTILEILYPWNTIVSLSMYALVFLVFEGDPLVNWLKYSAIDLAAGLVFLLTNFFLLALGYTHDQITVSTAAELPRFLLTHLVMGAAMWFACKYAMLLVQKLSKSQKFSHACSIITLLVCLCGSLFSSVFSTTQVTLSMVNAICVLFISFILIGAALISFLYWRFQKVSLQQENANLQKMLSMQYEHFQQLEQYQAQLHQQNHDFRHHLTVLKTLLADRESDSANGYLDALLESHANLPLVSHCGNLIVDAALDSKRILAENQGIQIQYEAQLPQALHPSDLDLSCAISNLLDNAIEACAQVEDGPRSITLSAHVTSGLLLIIVKNSCLSDRINFNFQTSKGQNHGWGLKILRDIAARNDGAFEITQNGDTVTAILSLSNPQTDVAVIPADVADPCH